MRPIILFCVHRNTSEDTHNRYWPFLNNKMPDDHFQVLRVEKVGPVVGQALRTKAVMAIVLALVRDAHLCGDTFQAL